MAVSGTATSPLLLAAARQPAGVTPVWFMRQAGRYLPEYRAIRSRHSLLEICAQPELAAEVTLQPVRRLGVDAAILYADILLPLVPMGLELAFASGEGPVIGNPIRTPGDVAALREVDVQEGLGAVLEAVRLVRGELDGRVALIGFAGAPFTVASYLIEGRPSRTYEHTKQLMHTEPALWHHVMERLAQHSVAFIDVQLRAGARAFQLFDSWAGALSRGDYDTYVLPHSRTVFTELGRSHPGVPGIHFGFGCDHLLESMLAAAGGDGSSTPVLGLDWRTTITDARRRMGADLVVQGNLDPALVLAGASTATAGAAEVLADNGGHPGHIFNLGHGVQPNSDPGVLAAVVELVHASDAPQAPR